MEEGGRGNCFGSNRWLFIGSCYAYYSSVSPFHITMLGWRLHTPFGIRTHFSYHPFLLSRFDQDLVCDRCVGSLIVSLLWKAEGEQEKRNRGTFFSASACWSEETSTGKKRKEKEGGWVMCHPTWGLFPLEGGREGGRRKVGEWVVREREWGV